MKRAGNLEFRTKRYMGVRDSDRIPARRGGFERAPRFPNSASVALQTEPSRSRGIKKRRFVRQGFLLAGPVVCFFDSQVNEVACVSIRRRTKKSKRPIRIRSPQGANSISKWTSFGYKSIFFLDLPKSILGEASPPMSLKSRTASAESAASGGQCKVVVRPSVPIRNRSQKFLSVESVRAQEHTG